MQHENGAKEMPLSALFFTTGTVELFFEPGGTRDSRHYRISNDPLLLKLVTSHSGCYLLQRKNAWPGDTGEKRSSWMSIVLPIAGC
jgi:hypothetical protein